MSEWLDFKHHISFTTCQETAQICEPLFASSDINTFLYARIYDTGEVIGLNSHHDYQVHHFKQQHIVTPPVPPDMMSDSFYFILTPNTVPKAFEQAYADFQHVLGMDYPLLLIERFIGFYELTFFATHVGNESIINFYLNRMEELKNFRYYFQQKASKLIELHEQHKIQIVDHMKPNITGLTAEELKKQKITSGLSRYYLPPELGGGYLTRTEFIIMQHLANARSYKTIGRLLNISPRTVETHVTNVKQKLGLHQRERLVEKLKKNYPNFTETRL